MRKLESNQMRKIRWDFQIPTDRLIPARKPDQVIINNNNNNKKERGEIICWKMEFAVRRTTK